MMNTKSILLTAAFILTFSMSGVAADRAYSFSSSSDPELSGARPDPTEYAESKDADPDHSNYSCYSQVRCPRGYNIWCEGYGNPCEAYKGWDWVWCGAWDDWSGWRESWDYCRW